MKMYKGVEVYIHIFLTLALVGGEWSPSPRLGHLPFGKEPHYTLDKRISGAQNQSGWFGEENTLVIAGNETQFLGCQSHSQYSDWASPALMKAWLQSVLHRHIFVPGWSHDTRCESYHWWRTRRRKRRRGMKLIQLKCMYAHMHSLFLSWKWETNLKCTE
jgi:hypothetical protein